MNVFARVGIHDIVVFGGDAIRCTHDIGFVHPWARECLAGTSGDLDRSTIHIVFPDR
jgi:hypothetical protein